MAEKAATSSDGMNDHPNKTKPCCMCFGPLELLHKRFIFICLLHIQYLNHNDLVFIVLVIALLLFTVCLLRGLTVFRNKHIFSLILDLFFRCLSVVFQCPLDKNIAFCNCNSL